MKRSSWLPDSFPWAFIAHQLNIRSHAIPHTTHKENQTYNTVVLGDQAHVIYRDKSGEIWDSWYEGSWKLQQIKLGGANEGVGDNAKPVPIVFNNQAHVFYRETAGKIWDSFYDGHWKLQQINSGGLTSGAATFSNPVPIIYKNTLHVFY